MELLEPRPHFLRDGLPLVERLFELSDGRTQRLAESSACVGSLFLDRLADLPAVPGHELSQTRAICLEVHHHRCTGRARVVVWEKRQDMAAEVLWVELDRVEVCGVEGLTPEFRNDFFDHPLGVEGALVGPALLSLLE